MATQVHLYPPIPEHALKISLEIHGDAYPEHAEYLVFIWMTCNIKNYSLMSLNVTITQPITLYLLEQYSIPLKPVLGGVRTVALTISCHEQTQLKPSQRLCCFLTF